MRWSQIINLSSHHHHSPTNKPRHSEPAAIPRPSSFSSSRGKKKGAKDKGSSSGGGGKKRRSGSAASASPLGEVEGRLSQMREELQALEARLAAARAEVAVVEGVKGMAAGGGSDDAVVVGQQERGGEEVEAGVDAQPQSEPDQQGARNGGAAERAPQPVLEEEEEAELVQLNMRASELGVGEETLEGEQEAQEQQPTAVASDAAATPEEEAKAPPPTGGNADAANAAAPTTAATATATAAPSTSGNNLRRFLSLSDLDSLRAFLLDHQVFGSVTGATSSLLQAFEVRCGAVLGWIRDGSLTESTELSHHIQPQVDPARSVFHSLALPRPETLLHLYKERVLADAQYATCHRLSIPACMWYLHNHLNPIIHTNTGARAGACGTSSPWRRQCSWPSRTNTSTSSTPPSRRPTPGPSLSPPRCPICCVYPTWTTTTTLYTNNIAGT